MRMTGGLEVLKGARSASAHDPRFPRSGGLGPAGTRLKESRLAYQATYVTSKIAKFDKIILIKFLKILKFSAEKLLSVDYIWTVLYHPQGHKYRSVNAPSCMSVFSACSASSCVHNVPS